MELESKDWRHQRFDETSQVVHVNGTQGVYVCTRSKPGCGACCYAVCQDCYIRAFGGETSRNKRIRNVVISPNAEKHNRCRHELHNLEFESDLWWCDPKLERGLFTWDWMYLLSSVNTLMSITRLVTIMSKLVLGQQWSRKRRLAIHMYIICVSHRMTSHKWGYPQGPTSPCSNGDISERCA